MSARLLLFGCLAPAAAQRCAVCFSGAARSFARPHVRRAAKARLVDALGCDVTDAFFYVALEELPLRHARRDWDDFAPAPNVAGRAERSSRRRGLRIFLARRRASSLRASLRPCGRTSPAVRRRKNHRRRSSTQVSADAFRLAALEFDPVAVAIHERDVAAADDDADAAAARPQLAKAAACFALVEAAEASSGRRYDWVVRSRPDLAWVAPAPPVAALRGDRVYVPGHFWPLGDMVAVTPRRYAEGVFRAVDALGDDGGCASEQVARVAGAGAPESALYRALAERAVPTQLYDGFAFALARHREGANCATLHLVHSSACAAARVFLAAAVYRPRRGDDAAFCRLRRVLSSPPRFVVAAAFCRLRRGLSSPPDLSSPPRFVVPDGRAAAFCRRRRAFVPDGRAAASPP